MYAPLTFECFNDWTLCVQSRQQTAVVYIDFAKAFDVVSHKKSFARLYTYAVRSTNRYVVS